MELSFTISEKALKASYHVAKLITRQKTASYWKKFIKTSMPENCWINAWTKEVKEVRKVPLPADTIKRRIDDMSNDILETLIKKIKKASPKFSFGLTKQQTLARKYSC